MGGLLQSSTALPAFDLGPGESRAFPYSLQAPLFSTTIANTVAAPGFTSIQPPVVMVDSPSGRTESSRRWRWRPSRTGTTVPAAIKLRSTRCPVPARGAPTTFLDRGHEPYTGTTSRQIELTDSTGAVFRTSSVLLPPGTASAAVGELRRDDAADRASRRP